MQRIFSSHNSFPSRAASGYPPSRNEFRNRTVFLFCGHHPFRASRSCCFSISSSAVFVPLFRGFFTTTNRIATSIANDCCESFSSREGSRRSAIFHKNISFSCNAAGSSLMPEIHFGFRSICGMALAMIVTSSCSKVVMLRLLVVCAIIFFVIFL